MKPKLVIFEGVDKSGKTTLKSLLNTKTHYKYWVLDRSIISSLVYDQIFDRNNRAYLLDCLFALTSTFDVRFILCTASKDIIEQRLSLHRESLDEKLSDIQRIQFLFANELMTHYCNYITIDTNSDINDCMNKILQFIQEEQHA